MRITDALIDTAGLSQAQYEKAVKDPRLLFAFNDWSPNNGKWLSKGSGGGSFPKARFLLAQLRYSVEDRDWPFVPVHTVTKDGAPNWESDSLLQFSAVCEIYATLRNWTITGSCYSNDLAIERWVAQSPFDYLVALSAGLVLPGCRWIADLALRWPCCTSVTHYTRVYLDEIADEKEYHVRREYFKDDRFYVMAPVSVFALPDETVLLEGGNVTLGDLKKEGEAAAPSEKTSGGRGRVSALLETLELSGATKAALIGAVAMLTVALLIVGALKVGLLDRLLQTIVSTSWLPAPLQLWAKSQLMGGSLLRNHHGRLFFEWHHRVWEGLSLGWRLSSGGKALTVVDYDFGDFLTVKTEEEGWISCLTALSCSALRVEMIGKPSGEPNGLECVLELARV